MTEHEHPEGITELVDALLEGYAPISGLLAHMFESPNEPSVDEVRDVLGVLLCDVLEPLALSYDAGELKTTAAVVAATVPIISEELFLVPHSAPRPNRAARRARGGRRNRRRT